MEKRLIALAEENKVDDLVTAVTALKTRELCQMIENRCVKGKSDTFPLVRAVLLGSPPDDAASNDRRLEVYKTSVNILQRNEMNNKMAAELVGLLMLEADALPGPSLAELTSLYVDAIKSGAAQSGKALELFPKLLSAIAAKDNIVYGGNERSGKDYKSHILNSLCSCRWDSQSVIHLAAMFRDVPLTNEELRFVMEKVLRMFKDLAVPDLPALVYQLLLLSTMGHKKLVLEGVTRFFTDMDHRLQKPAEEQEFSEDLLSDGNDLDVLRQTEGTVILHISFAAKQEQELGREFVKYLKSKQLCCATQTLAPFSLALALSLARIHRFEDQVFNKTVEKSSLPCTHTHHNQYVPSGGRSISCQLVSSPELNAQIYDFIKATILKSYKDAERLEQSSWVREVVTEESSVEDSVLQTVNNSKFGWDHVVQGLVHLGFLLMDSFGPKAVFGKIDVLPSVQPGPSREACQLGAKILLNTFKAHEMVRTEILEQIFNRVVTKATSPVSHYLELLGDTVYAAPQMLLEASGKVREMFDYLSFLSPGSSEGLLTAIQPLLKLSMALKDSLILVLRKAMFSRMLDSRKIGCSGFLMILKHFKILGGLMSSQSSQASISSSQVAVDVHVPYNPSSNEALCLEILGNLRRCLSQQADVRLLLYEGLLEVLSRNTQLRAAILEMLLAQLKGFYERVEDVIPPLKLEPCIVAQGDQVYLAEPLAHLLCCIQLCLVKCAEVRQTLQGRDEEEDLDSEVQTQLQHTMESLTLRMIKSDMEDFELDKSADYSLATSVGVRNNIFAILVLGTYEVLMEYNFMTGCLSENSIQLVVQLFDNHRKLSDLLREKMSAGGKKGKSSGKIPNSLLSIKMVVNVLDTLVSDDSASPQAVLEGVRTNLDFTKYILTVCQQKVQQIQDRGKCAGAEGSHRSTLFHHCCTIGRQLLKYYIENQKIEDGGQRSREKSLLTLSLEGLVSVVTIVTQRYPSQLVTFLVAIENADKESENEMVKDEKIHQHIKRFQRLEMNILTADEDRQNLKDAVLLLNVIFSLSRALSATSSPYSHAHSWLQTLCTEQAIDDLPMCKLLLGSLLSMNQRQQSSPVLLRDLAQDIHSQLGDIDQEIEVDSRTHFALVTQRSAAPTVLQLVLQQCEKELDDTDWVIARVKAETLSTVSAQSDEDTVGLTQREGHEKSICTRLGILVTAVHELVQSCIPVGPCMETILKVLTRLYNTLTTLVKYYLTLYTQKMGHFSARFEKLVKLSGTHLTQYCYAMITYIQTSEREHLQTTSDKGKKKKDEKKKPAAAQAGKSVVLKQTRTIPNLIYAIEQYEKFLVQLSKKSKVNLMAHMKNSTSRDFRINMAALQEALDNQSSSDDGSDNDDDDNDGDHTPAVDDTVQERNEEASSAEEEDSDQENEPPPNKKQKPNEDDPVKKPASRSKIPQRRNNRS